jgi:hypothetical protein
MASTSSRYEVAGGAGGVCRGVQGCVSCEHAVSGGVVEKLLMSRSSNRLWQ